MTGDCLKKNLILSDVKLKKRKYINVTKFILDASASINKCVTPSYFPTGLRKPRRNQQYNYHKNNYTRDTAVYVHTDRKKSCRQKSIELCATG